MTDERFDRIPQRLSLEELTSNLLWTAAADGLLVVDRVGTIRATNAALDTLFGYEPGAVVGSTLEVLVPEEARRRHVVHRTRFDAQPTDRPMADGLHFRGLRADGATFPVSVGISHVVTLDGPMSVASIRDVSERERVEAKLALAQRRSAVSAAHDRIASDLHDTVVQRLFALGLELHSQAESVSDESSERVFAGAVDTIDDIIQEIRETIYGLQREDRTLVSTTDRILDVVVEMQPSLGLVPDLTMDARIDDIDDAVVVEHACKVLREAISNASRHADASAVRIDVSLVEEHLVLVVEDNGRGLPDPAALRDVSDDQAPRYGLASMRRRAEGLGGSMSLSSNSPSGTRLRWSAPVGTDVSD